MKEETKIRGRFAPTPSGRMHLGNIFTALMAWLDVRSRDGAMVLRIEDLDRQRCKNEKNSSALLEDLLWLGLDWDEGGEPSHRQSNRQHFYDAAMEYFRKENLIYPCFCTRKELHSIQNAPHEGDKAVIYGEKCRFLTAEEIAQKDTLPNWRIKTDDRIIRFRDEIAGEQCFSLRRECGDFILQRADSGYSYQLAVSVDDGEMGINRVVRGNDLLTSTPWQIYLLQLLGYPLPSYMHIPLLVGKDGRRLSKRDDALHIEAWRNKQVDPRQIIGYLGWKAGLLPKGERATPAELVPLFDPQKIPRGFIDVKREELMLYGL